MERVTGDLRNLMQFYKWIQVDPSGSKEIEEMAPLAHCGVEKRSPRGAITWSSLLKTCSSLILFQPKKKELASNGFRYHQTGPLRMADGSRPMASALCRSRGGAARPDWPTGRTASSMQMRLPGRAKETMKQLGTTPTRSTGFCSVSLGFYRVSWVLLGSTGFYWVLLNVLRHH